MAKRRKDMQTMTLGFTCVHQDGEKVCGQPAKEGSQFCIIHQPGEISVPAEATLPLVGEAVLALESDLFNANALDNWAKRDMAALEDEYDTVPSPDGGVIHLSKMTPKDRAIMEGNARDNAVAASRIRKRVYDGMYIVAKLGLLVGPKGQTPHEIAAKRMQELGVSEEEVEMFRKKHKVPSAGEDSLHTRSGT